jgi:RsmE family RNA methyltransferase
MYFDMTGEKINTINDKDFLFYIGPEGGWSNNDKELFKKYKVTSSSLGQTTLRAETAAIIAAYKTLWG